MPGLTSPGLTSEFAASVSLRQSVVLAIAVFAFLGSLYIFARDQHAISTINGWWGDELFSLWASEPTQRFGDALAQRILPDRIRRSITRYCIGRGKPSAMHVRRRLL